MYSIEDFINMDKLESKVFLVKNLNEESTKTNNEEKYVQIKV